MLQANADLARRLDALEQKYDAKFKVVFDAIRALALGTLFESQRVDRPHGRSAR